MDTIKEIDVPEVEDAAEETVYSLEEAVELTGHGRYNYLVLAACSIISNGVALDMFGFSVVVAAASCDLKLGLAETGALASVPFAGVVAAYPWGYFADTGGRRRALLLSSCVGSVMAALSSFAPSWQAMLVLKFIGCAFSTASFTLTMTYLGECTGARHRDRHMFIVTAVNLSSEFVSFALAYILLPLDFNVPLSWLSITFRPWRLLTFMMAAVLGLGALLMFFLEESPKFLADRGDAVKSLEVLKKIFEVNGGKNGEYPVKHLKIDESNRHGEPFCRSLQQQTLPLFKPPLLWRTLQLFYLITIACSTNNVFLMWFATMVNIFFKSVSEGTKGTFCERVVFNGTSVDPVNPTVCNDTISPNTLYSGMIYGLFFTIVTLVVSRVAAWRRLLLLVTFVVTAASGILVDLLEDPWANMLAFILLQGTILGIGSVASYFNDMYPTACRGMAFSLAMMVARVMSFFGVNLVGRIIVNHCAVTFYCWSAFIFSGVLVALLLPADRPGDPAGRLSEAVVRPTEQVEQPCCS